jgi:hypothetical protein
MKQSYVCTKKCFHGPPARTDGTGPSWKTYFAGDRVEFDPEMELVPESFVPFEEYTPAPAASMLGGGQAIIRGLKSPIDAVKLAKGQNKAAAISADKKGK